ncbi:bifunctional metallophosphatase/5'-nucleotidase [Collibacillus ludicampi]|nr:5'-nucleotidase C-terminal domain-containing protein [Collibacillus ludicampi]
MNIHLIHTNDVHSHYEEFLKLASSIRDLRDELQARGEIVFLFDIGDHADRSRAETDGTFGLTNAALLRELGYDGFVFGNNEGLTLPQQSWEAFCQEASIPVLVSNLFKLEDGRRYPFFREHSLIYREGVTLGVFGLTAPFATYYERGGVQVVNPEECAVEQVRILREKGADIIVLLSHLGLKADRRIAANVPGIDVILGGHTHHVLERPERVGDTWIGQAGKYAAYYGHMVLDYDHISRKVRDVSGIVIPNEEENEVDGELARVFSEWREVAQRTLSTVVADLPCTLYNRIDGESPLANLLADELRLLTGTEIAFFNTGTLLSSLGPGAVTKMMLLNCCPSPIMPVTGKYTGAELKRIFAKSLLPAYFEKIGFGFGFRGREIGTMAVSGVTWEVGHDGALLSVRVGDQPLLDDHLYSCATIDYLTFSGVYEEVKLGRHLRHEPIFLRELLERALKDPGALERAYVPRRIRKE